MQWKSGGVVSPPWFFEQIQAEISNFNELQAVCGNRVSPLHGKHSSATLLKSRDSHPSTASAGRESYICEHLQM
jgi:hypothetical protein